MSCYFSLKDPNNGIYQQKKKKKSQLAPNYG